MVVLWPNFKAFAYLCFFILQPLCLLKFLLNFSEYILVIQFHCLFFNTVSKHQFFRSFLSALIVCYILFHVNSIYYSLELPQKTNYAKSLTNIFFDSCSCPFTSTCTLEKGKEIIFEVNRYEPLSFSPHFCEVLIIFKLLVRNHFLPMVFKFLCC